VLASHSRFGLSDGASSQAQEELSFLQDTSCQDFSYLQDFDLLLLSPDHLHTHYQHINQSNTNTQSNFFNKQQSDYNNLSDCQNQSYYQESTVQFTYTFADLPIACDQTSYTDIELPDTSQTAHSSPAQTQKPNLTNAERCKIFRERQKKKEKQLLEEKEIEEKKNTELNIRAKFLEEKVAKLKKIYLKRAKTHQMLMPGENLLFMFDC